MFSLSYRNQSINLLRNNDRDPRHEQVKTAMKNSSIRTCHELECSISGRIGYPNLGKSWKIYSRISKIRFFECFIKLCRVQRDIMEYQIL